MDRPLFTIRPATAADATQLLAELHQDTVLKALEDQAIIGSVRATVSDNICQIGRLMVHPSHQGCGLGTALMQAIEALFPSVSGFELFTGSRRSHRTPHGY